MPWSLAALLAIAAPTGSQAMRSVVFACADGTRLAVAFDGSDPRAPAIVRPQTGPALTLAAQPTGSGFTYGDGLHVLRGKGREVTWTEGGKPPLVCAEAAPAD